MQDFVYYAPTKVIFGKGAGEKTGEELKKLGASRVLVVYGGESAVRSGLIDRVRASLEQAGLSCSLFGGAKPNPTLKHVEEGIAKAVDEKSDFILAVGGGSTIDTAKGIAHGAANAGTPLWDLWTTKVPLTKSLPVGAVLTIAAAGSEMSDSAVLTNEALNAKLGINTEFNRCRIAFMDPELLFTVPKYHLAAGITDIMMHTMERYFIRDIQCTLTDTIAEGLLKTVMENGRRIMADPTDYDAMAEVMWCSTLSHNGLTECGRGKDFSVHKLGMPFSALYDHTHGATLSAVWGSWARYQMDAAQERFARYARMVLDIRESDDTAAAEAGIRASEEYWKSIGMPVRIPELGEVATDDEALMKMAMMATKNDTVKLSRLKPLGAKEVAEIYRMAC